MKLNLEEENKKLKEALEQIANPIAYFIQKAKKEGMEINGLAAVKLSENAHYLQEIAKKALEEI